MLWCSPLSVSGQVSSSGSCLLARLPFPFSAWGGRGGVMSVSVSPRVPARLCACVLAKDMTPSVSRIYTSRQNLLFPLPFPPYLHDAVLIKHDSRRLASSRGALDLLLRGRFIGKEKTGHKKKEVGKRDHRILNRCSKGIP